MKVLMIEHFSSTSMYSMDLCDNLGKIADVELLTVNDSVISGKRPYQYHKILYGHYDTNKLFTFILYARSLLRCFWKIKMGNYDIIHIQSFRNIKIEMYFLALLKNKKAKYIHTVHNVLPHEATQKDKQLYGKFYFICDELILHNKASVKAFKDIFPSIEKKINIVPHGSYSYIKDLVSPAQNVSGKTTFFMLGLIRKYKGVDILIDALSRIPKDQRDKYRVIIAGRQDKRLDNSDYKKLIRENNLEEIVSFIPTKISDQEMANYYNISDACVFPYRNIYGSGALLMAYTFEKPVIASDIPAFIEETDNGSTGLLFKNGDAADLAKIIQQFANMDGSDRLIFTKNIRNLTENKYNWKVIADKTLAVYLHNRGEDNEE